MKRHLLLLLILGIVSGLSPHTTSAAPAAQQDEVFSLINQLRQTYSLTGFTYNASLAAAAQQHAQWMADNNNISHTGANGSRPQDRANNNGYAGQVSENIVGGTALTPFEGFTWWQNSPVHLNTMLSQRHSEGGIGFATDGTWNYYALVVGRPGSIVGTTAAQTGSSNSSATANNAAPVVPQSDPLVVVPIQMAEAAEDGSIVHTVQQGQTAWALAIRYDVPLATVFAYNNMNDSSTLKPGDLLIMKPADSAEPIATPTPSFTHTIQSGDTLWQVANRHGIPLTELLYLNSFDANTVVQPGDVVVIRLQEGQDPPPAPTKIASHTLRSGETLWTVAAYYNVPLEELLTLNGLTESSILQPGDEIILYAALPTVAPSATPTWLPTATIAVEQTPDAMQVALSGDGEPIEADAEEDDPNVTVEAVEDSNSGGSMTMALLLAGVAFLLAAGTMTVVVMQKE